jgi:hypothetical protein
MVTATIIVLQVSAVALASPPAEPQRDLHAGILKGMAYLETKGLTWMRAQKCASCHHVPMMVWVQKEARRRSIEVDEAGLQEATEFLLAGDNRANILDNPDKPRPGDENSAKMGPLYALLAFRENPALPAADPDETIPRWTAYLRSKQQADGSWLAHRAKPPISLNDEESMTLTVLYSLGADVVSNADAKQSQTLARRWLASNFKGVTHHSLCWSILAGYEREAAAAQLLQRQNADGGWSQTKEMASDAHATGQALYAMLSRRTQGTDDAALVKARDFLLKTQTPDGSWSITSRPRPDKEDSAGANNLEPITYAATAWAVLALLQCLPSSP